MHRTPLDDLKSIDIANLAPDGAPKQIQILTQNYTSLPDDYRAVNPERGRAIHLTPAQGLVIIDVDTKNGDGWEDLATLEKTLGTLPPTFQEGTPSGGGHLYYRSTAPIVQTAGALGTKTIDTRTGHSGGLVYCYPTRGYDIEANLPFADLPQSWESALRQKTAPAPAPAPAGSRDYTREDLETLAKGKKDPFARAMRHVAKGQRFVQAAGGPSPEPPTNQSGVDDFLTRLMYHLAHQWPDASRQSLEDLFAPSVSILIADDNRLGNKSYEPHQIVDKFFTALEKQATEALEAEAERGDARMLMSENRYFFEISPGVYSTDYPAPQIPFAMRDHGFDIYRPTKTGEIQMAAHQLMEKYGRGGSVDQVVYALTGKNEYDKKRKILTQVTPKLYEGPAIFHPEIDTWLETLDPTGRVKDFISVATELDQACPALFLNGEGSVGKSLIVKGLAALYLKKGGVPLSRAIHRFNDDILENPIIEAAETLDVGDKYADVLNLLKELISSTSFTVEQKGKPRRNVRGAVRVIIGANDISILRVKATATARDVRALGDRFIYVEIPPQTGEVLRQYLNDFQIQQDWIDGGRLVEHFAWIIKNRAKPEQGQRLRLAPSSEQLQEHFNHSSGGAHFFLETLWDWAESAAEVLRSGETPQGDGILWHNGTILFTKKAIKSRLSLAGHGSIGLSGPIERCCVSKESTRISLNNNRYYQLKQSTLRDWAIRGTVSAAEYEEITMVLEGIATNFDLEATFFEPIPLREGLAKIPYTTEEKLLTRLRENPRAYATVTSERGKRVERWAVRGI